MHLGLSLLPLKIPQLLPPGIVSRLQLPPDPGVYLYSPGKAWLVEARRAGAEPEPATCGSNPGPALRVCLPRGWVTQAQASSLEGKPCSEGEEQKTTGRSGRVKVQGSRAERLRWG